MEENNIHTRTIAYELYPPVLRPAEKGLRLANYLIDMLVFYCLIVLYGLLVGIIITIARGGDTSFIDELDNAGRHYFRCLVSHRLSPQPVFQRSSCCNRGQYHRSRYPRWPGW